MRILLPALLLCISFYHSTAQSISYDQGLKYCDSIRTELNKQNEATGTYTGVRANCLTGAMLPSFTATTMDGKVINRDYFIGKITVLNFWMKSCGPCIAEIPGLNKIKEKFGTEKINFLAIGRCNEEEAETFLKLHPWNFDQVRNGQPLIEEIFKFSWGYPVTMVINKKGEIVMSFNGGLPGEWAVQHIQDTLIPRLEAELLK